MNHDSTDRSGPREWKMLHTAALAGREEWPQPSDSSRIEIHATAQPVSHVLCVTKVLAAQEIIQRLGRHHPIAIVVCPVIPDPWNCGIIRCAANQAGGLLRFVGDLDPLDLAIYTCLRRGGNDMSFHPRTRVRTRWIGVCGDWLNTFGSHLRKEFAQARPVTETFEQPMSPFEQHAMRVLMQVAPELRQELDEIALNLLFRSRKVEIDALLNDALYIPTHRRARTAYLRWRLLGIGSRKA